MLVVMNPGATPEQISAVRDRAAALGWNVQDVGGHGRVVLSLSGKSGPLDAGRLTGLAGIDNTIALASPNRLSSWNGRSEPTRFPIASTHIGGGFTIIAGPCSVEDESSTIESARFLTRLGVRLLRGGAFKPRTSPYSFQGLGLEGLPHLQKARQETGAGIVTEVLEIENVPRVEEVADVIQVGARSMQNYPLLRRLGRCRKPILLKRGPAASIDEWLLAAEYILSGGNEQVILCERGVRSFSDHARNTLDLAVIPALRQRTHLPVIVDPSHSSGHAAFVAPLSLAALAAGADGLLIEVHRRPCEARSDGAQAISFEEFASLYEKLSRVAKALGVSLQ